MNNISQWSSTAARQSVNCPKCGAAINEFCVTPKNRKAKENHWQRGKQYLDSIGMDEWMNRHSSKQFVRY